MTTAQTRQGKVRGLSQDGVHAFLGVPFAKPPVGKLRFRPPESPESWSGERDATAYGPSAPQQNAMGFLPGMDIGEQSEDCLYLNVWTPSTQGRRPVMVWIHGGAFIFGAGSQTWYAGNALAKRGDVVVVTINYRLGALGFCHLEPVGGADFAGAANAGILDQIAALEWVRDNIESFGGDTSNVTIFGESAGGMSVGALLGAPRAKGLFARAIPQSGAAHTVLASDDATEGAEKLLRALDLTPDRSTELFEVPVERMLAAQASMPMQASGRLPFGPAVDGDLLPRPPFELIAEGGSRDVSVLIGTTRDEFKLFAMMAPQSFSDEAALAKALGPSLFEAVGRAPELVAAYRAARAARGDATDLAEIYSAILTDRIFRIPAIRLAEAQSALQPKTYSYLFTWPSAIPTLGSCHALELPFVFGTLDEQAAPFTGSGPDAQQLSGRMMDAWIAFARTGDPAHGELPAWPAYDAKRRATMVLDRECSVVDDPMGAERSAWDGVL